MSAALHRGDLETEAEALDELPLSLVLNSFALRCPGAHHVTRIPKPVDREARRELGQKLGTTLFGGENGVYAAGEVDAPGAHVIDLACDAESGLHLFDLRAAIAGQARNRGFRAWFGFGGEIHVIGLPGEQHVDSIVIQRRLRLRVLEEGREPERETRVVARHGTRWLVSGSLAETEVRQHAIGESADRLDGNGPSRGEIVSFDGEEVVLRNRGHDEHLPARNYALRANSSYVRRHYGAKAFRALQVASGSLTQSGKKNQYAVKDRFDALIDDMHAIGLVVDMPGGRQAVISPSWVEIRVQEAS